MSPQKSTKASGLCWFHPTTLLCLYSFLYGRWILRSTSSALCVTKHFVFIHRPVFCLQAGISRTLVSLAVDVGFVYGVVKQVVGAPAGCRVVVHCEGECSSAAVAWNLLVFLLARPLAYLHRWPSASSFSRCCCVDLVVLRNLPSLSLLCIKWDGRLSSSSTFIDVGRRDESSL